MKRIVISLNQAVVSICLVTIGTVFFPVAGVVVPLAGVSGWISVLIAFVISVPWALMAVGLAQKVEANDFGAAVFKLLGPWIGRVFLLYYVLIWTWLGGILLLQMGTVFNGIALPRTPTMVLNILLLLVIVFTAMRGLEVFLRTIQILGMTAIPFLLGFALTILPNIKLENLRPILGTAPGLIAHAAYLSLPWVMEGILFSFFVSTMVRSKKKLKLMVPLSIASAGVLITLVVVINVAVLGLEVAKHYLYPTFVMARLEPRIAILSGAEIFLFPLWIIASYIKTGASFLMVCSSLEGIYRKLKRPYLVLGVAAVFLIITFLPKNSLGLVAQGARIDNTWFMAGYLLFPLVYAFVSLTKREGEQ